MNKLRFFQSSLPFISLTNFFLIYHILFQYRNPSTSCLRKSTLYSSNVTESLIHLSEEWLRKMKAHRLWELFNSANRANSVHMFIISTVLISILKKEVGYNSKFSKEMHLIFKIGRFKKSFFQWPLKILNGNKKPRKAKMGDNVLLNKFLSFSYEPEMSLYFLHFFYKFIDYLPTNIL